MNNVMLAAMIVARWEILVILLVVLVWIVIVGGIVLLVVRLARRGQDPKPGQPYSQVPPQPSPTTSPAATCPRCGAPLPANSPQGLCPRCVLGVGLATQTEATGDVGPHGTKVIKPPPAPDEIGKHFPQLEILECLGRGGMGVVYKARQPKLNRIVALKILAPEKEAQPKFAERFLREAQTLARLNHPNIVTVHDFGETDGLCYLLMEFVDGLTLRQMMREGRMKPEEALAIVPRICEALQFAHEQGVVHRDIKPENVLLDKQGRVKIADFGIAKIVGGTGQPLSRPADTLSPSDGERAGERGAGSLTQDQVLGTPHYMAPEQVEKPATVDHRADIYSLGVVFYEMLTGELPLGKFQSPSRMVQVDVRLDEVVLHALEKNPDRRYQHASEVKTDVETIASTPAKDHATGSPRRGLGEVGSGLGDVGRFTTSMLPELLPGEHVVHFKRRVWAVFNYSPPACRLFFSLPPLWEAGLYITDRRVMLVSHLLGVFGQEFSIWFSRNVQAGQRELFQKVSTGKSFLLGDCLDIRSEAPDSHWYRGRGLLLRIYTRQPELLQEKIVAAKSSAATMETSAQSFSGMAGPDRAGSAGESSWVNWVNVARWTARAFSMLLLAFYGFFILGEGLPPIASQPGAVQLNFAALGLMLLGFVVGWKREGAAALLIASGWTLWRISEGHMRWDLFHTPLPVAALYGFCWWATQRRKTRVVAAVLILLAAALGLGRLFVPTSVFVRGAVVDAQTGTPLPNAELRLRPQTARSVEKGDPANARSDIDGRFTLYVGWYAAEKEVAISASGYTTLTTNLGPRELGQRNVSRDFQLQPTDAAVVPIAAIPPVVIETSPQSGAANVDPALTELRVTFSKPMQDGSWAWTIWGEENFPEKTGEPRYLPDGRTCVLPVKLKPGKLYTTWLNSDYFQDFKDREGHSAVPYLLIFETRK